MHSIAMDDIWPDKGHKERDAYFQAGCAIVALRESLEVIRVTIDDPDDATTSWIDLTYPDFSRALTSGSVTAYTDAISVIRTALAGPATLLRYSFGTYPQDCHPPEFNLADPWMMKQEAAWRAIALAGKISKDSPSLVRSVWQEVTGIIQGDEVWPAIEAVAEILLLTGELAGCEIRDIARHAMGSRAIGF